MIYLKYYSLEELEKITKNFSQDIDAPADIQEPFESKLDR